MNLLHVLRTNHDGNGPSTADTRLELRVHLDKDRFGQCVTFQQVAEVQDRSLVHCPTGECAAITEKGGMRSAKLKPGAEAGKEQCSRYAPDGTKKQCPDRRTQAQFQAEKPNIHPIGKNDQNT